MKFLILSQYFQPEVGAAQTRLAATSQALKKRGHDVQVVTAMPNYPMGEIADGYKGRFYVQEELDGVSVYRFWLWASQGRTLGRLMAYLSFMVTSCFGVLAVRRPEVIFVNSGPIFMGLAGFVYAKVFRVPMIFYVADLWPRSVEHLQGFGGQTMLRFALRLESWIYRHSEFVVAVTEGVRDILIRDKKLAPGKVLFLPNGVDASVFYPRAKKMELVESYNLKDKKVFIYAGNHGYAHALESVLLAAEILLSHPDIVFMFVGGGSEKPKLIEMARKKNLKNVIFVDPVAPEVLADYIQISYIGLIHVRKGPLAQETRPAKMFPLMAMEKAIVYAGIGEGAGLLETCGGGWVVEPENPKALADKVLELSQMPEEVKNRGDKNLAFVRQNLSFDKLVDDWLKTFRIG